MHAALRKRHGTQLRIAAGVVAGVIADGAALRQLRRGQPCGKALRRAANSEVVQAIRADAHNAADARGAELQLCAEAALALRLVVLHGGQRSAPGLIQRRLLAPLLITFQFRHFSLLKYGIKVISSDCQICHCEPREGPWQSRRIGCGFWQAEANPKPASRDSHVASLLGITRPGKLTNAPPQWDGALCRPVISKTVRSGAAFPHRLHASPAATAEGPALPASSPPGR